MIMRRESSNKIVAAILGTTALAVLSSAVALFSAWQIAALYHTAVTDNLPALRAAEELEIALLEQRGFVSSYMIEGGNPQWLEELERRKGTFHRSLAEAQEYASTPRQTEILRKLARVYQTYDGCRDEVVALYDQGDTGEAYLVFLYDLNLLHHDAYLLCEAFVAANQRYVDSATARARLQIRRVTWMVAVCVGLTVGLGSTFLWVFARGLRTEQAKSGYEAHLLAARKIQEHLLPDTVPELPGFDVHSLWHPAEFAAGDYFDYLRFSDGSLGVVIADVTGHGVGPALLAASTRAYLRLLVQTRTHLPEIVATVNSILARDIGEGRFLTLLLGHFALGGSRLTYVNAGHPSGYVLDDSGNVKARLKSTALPLGVVPDASFPAGNPVLLAPGDVVVLLSDGVLEARSADGDFFGTERVLECVRANRSRPAREIGERLYQAVCAHARPGRFTDDVTATVIKIEPEQDGSQAH
jgi:CHASE3 domain sensor protein